MLLVLISVTVFVMITTFDVRSTRCELLPKPLNQYAMLSDKKNVVLECNSTLGYRLTWFIKKPGSLSRCEIFNGYDLVEDVYNVSSYCQVENGIPGKYELNVKGIEEAAQRYICLEPISWIEASAEVTIIESHPECSVTSYNESIIFTCHVRFRGNWAPVMEWRNDSNGEAISERVYIISIPNKSLTSRLIVPFNESHDCKMFYTCTTHFRIQEKPLETTANNIPPYSYNWTSPAIEPEGRAAKDAVLATCVLVPMIALVSVLSCWAKKRHTEQLKCLKDSQNLQEKQKFTNSMSA